MIEGAMSMSQTTDVPIFESESAFIASSSSLLYALVVPNIETHLRIVVKVFLGFRPVLGCLLKVFVLNL